MYDICAVDASWLAKKNYRAERLISGSLSEIVWVKDKFRCEQVCLIWDGFNSRKLRRDIMPDYKAGRTPFEREYHEQVGVFKHIVRSTSIDQLFPVDAEADDGAWTISQSGRRVLLYSCDKDWFQCVNNNTDFYRLTLESKLLTAENWINQSISPESWAVYQALTGDMVDNIRGVPRIGEKKAADLMDRHGDVIKEMVQTGDSGKLKHLSDMLDDSDLSRVLDNLEVAHESYLLTRMYQVDMDVMEGERESGLFNRLICEHVQDLVKYIPLFRTALF